MRTSTFIEIFIKKYIASKNDNDVYFGIPNSLKKLSFHNYYKLIKHLDPYNTDFVNLKFIGTYFCILNNRVCHSKDEEMIRSEAEKYSSFFDEGMLTKEQFIKIPMWFDSEEESPTLPSILNFTYF